jgi:outer membrane protein OmpA-like peptidoglycan-associated protein
MEKRKTMKKGLIALMSVGILLFATGGFAQQSDSAGCKDHPLFPTRMPDYRLAACKVEEYGVYEFWSVKGPKTSVEGRFTFLTYAFTGQRAAEPSGLAVVRNYENAIKKVGGTILGSVPDRWVNGKIVKEGQETWAQIEKGNGKIWLRIVEKKAMEQYIVADAAALGNDIRATGRAAVYGILFDTGKSTIKPESAQAIGEIAKLLKADPTLKIHVVGHTDNVGDVDSNTKLSKDRGEAVLQALVRDHGIAAARLRSYGCGQFAPVASNDTEEGRAKNRRVELVKQ